MDESARELRDRHRAREAKGDILDVCICVCADVFACVCVGGGVSACE